MKVKLDKQEDKGPESLLCEKYSMLNSSSDGERGKLITNII